MQWNDTDTESKGDLIEAGGKYRATVIEAEEKVSKAGNDYINLKLQIHAKDDKSITSYVVIMGKYYSKLKNFCISAGLNKQLINQTLSAHDCEGSHCCVVMTQKKNERGYFEVDDFEFDDIQQADYLKAKEQPAQMPDDDDVPF